MWSAILTLLAKAKAKNQLKKEQRKQTLNNQLEKAKDTKEIKKIKRKLKWLNITLVATIVIPIIAMVLVFILICYAIISFANVASYQILARQEQEIQAEADDGKWEWADQTGGLNDYTSGGVYPKDPQLRQTAMFLEVIQESCNIVNGEQGQINVVPSSVLSTLLRETGGRSYNAALADLSFNIYGELLATNPICGKSASSCPYIQHNISHFVGGTASGGVDNGDPHTMPPNTDSTLYKKYKPADGHALGYGQMEITSIPSELIRVFPYGDFKNKVYNDKTDRYTMDSELKFIRPNIAYMPDVVLSITYHLGGKGFWSTGQKIWNEMNSESWFQSLSAEEKAYCHSCIQQMSYLGGGVDYDNTNLMKLALKLSWALKADGKISRIQELIQFTDKQYGKTMVASNYGNFRFTRSGNSGLTDALNNIMSDTSIGTNTTSVSAELKTAIGKASGGAESTFLYYGTGGYKWRHGVPMLIGFESIADSIYNGMMADIQAAEKESGGNGPVSTAGGNYVDYIGSGKFANAKSSEYYCPDLNAIWFAQWGYKGGDYAFGTTLPNRITDIQKKKYYNTGYYGSASGGNSWGCPAYSMSMLLSNMLGEVIMPDELPGTTTAGVDWRHGRKNLRNVSTSGYGFSCTENTIADVNDTLNARGAGYTLKFKKLTRSQLQSCQSHLYEWLDRGAMIWCRVDKSNDLSGGGTHCLTIAGYDKSKQSGSNYDLILLNSGPGTSYTLVDHSSGQRASASLLNAHGLDYYLRNWGSGAPCCVVIWRTDIADTLPGL